MAKRASVQDRADDVFFGLADGASPEPPQAQEERRSVPVHEAPTAERPAQATRKAPPKPLSLHARLSADAKINAAFRFSEAELDELDDFVRDAKRLHGLRVSKQDVVRLALALLMESYREEGEESPLILELRSR